MKTLKDLIEEYKYYDVSDIDIIKDYFTLNNMEEEAIGIMNDLAKSKMKKLRMKNAVAEEWVCMLPSKYLYENYKLDIADRLHRLELDFLVRGGKLSNSNMEWARKNIPNIKEPKCYFVPLIELLNKNGIRFKN